MVFIEKKNITKWKFIEQAALTCGIDSALLLKDNKGKAIKLFKEDLDLATLYEITSFPTLSFSNGTDSQIKLKGLQPYEKFEEIIHQLLPHIKKAENRALPQNLFTLFSNMTENEFSFLNNISIEESKTLLNKLFLEEKIEKLESKNGIIWKQKNQ